MQRKLRAKGRESAERPAEVMVRHEENPGLGESWKRWRQTEVWREGKHADVHGGDCSPRPVRAAEAKIKTEVVPYESGGVALEVTSLTTMRPRQSARA